MSEKKINAKLNNKIDISEIHASLLDLYRFLKVDKLQIVSKKLNNKL